MTDKEFAEELDAGKRIMAYGYTKEKCPVCKGLGWMFTVSHDEIVCFGCNGKGYKWKAPIV